MSPARKPLPVLSESVIVQNRGPVRVSVQVNAHVLQCSTTVPRHYLGSITYMFTGIMHAFHTDILMYRYNLSVE